MNIKNFKEIATGIANFFQVYWFYKKNLNRYLSMRNISSNQFKEIKKELVINFKMQVKDEMDEKILAESKTLFHIQLMVESFYNNYELFNLFSRSITDDRELYYKFYEKIFNTPINETVKTYQATELLKSLNKRNSEDLYFIVLTKALNNGNVDLLNIIKPYIDWSAENSKVVHEIIMAVFKNGKKLKNTPMEEEIKKIINKDNLLDYLTERTQLSDDRQKFFNYFFDTDILTLISKDDFNRINLEQISYKKAKSVLKNIDRKNNYSKKISEFVAAHYSKISLKEKFEFLNKEKLLTKDIWNKLIQVENKDFISILFKNKDSLSSLIDSEYIAKIMEEYKNHILQSFNNNNLFKEFVENYPLLLTQDNLLELMSRDYQKFSYVNDLYQEAKTLIDNKYPDQLKVETISNIDTDPMIQDYLEKNSQWLNVLYDKYPDIMNSKEFLLKFLNKCSNDILLESYLERYFKDNNDEEFKKEAILNIRLFNNYSCQKTLKWVINNNLIKVLISKHESVGTNTIFGNVDNNMWVPILIEKYHVEPDTIIKQTMQSFVTNKELFKFVLHNYEISHKTQQSLCNSVFATNETELAQELFKKGIVPNDYYEDKFKTAPTQAGNILLNAKVKERLENLETKEKPKRVIKI